MKLLVKPNYYDSKLRHEGKLFEMQNIFKKINQPNYVLKIQLMIVLFILI